MEVYCIFKSSHHQIFKSNKSSLPSSNLISNASFDGIVDYLIDIGSDIEIREFELLRVVIYWLAKNTYTS